MKSISFTYRDPSRIDTDRFDKIADDLIPEIQTVRDELPKGYDSTYASLHAIHDTKRISTVKRLVVEKQKFNPQVLIVVGIGGSNLGTLAVHEALNGLLYNELTSQCKVYFADTVDAENIFQILHIAEAELKRGGIVLVNVVTKSGTTTETIANFELFLSLLMCYHPENYHEYIIVTTDEGSCLAQIAKKNSYACLTVPKSVGGRFSVFSAVGLFPLALIGIDIDQFLVGARTMQRVCISEDIKENSAAASAIIKYAHVKDGITINDFFVFSVWLESFGKWYRQLIGESLGKTRLTDGKKVGITPTVSIGSTDLHSVGQLYLGGPGNIFTTFVSVEHVQNDCSIPKLNEFEKCVANIQDKSLSLIMNAIRTGVMTAYTNNDRPFCSIIIPECSSYYVGQLMQMYQLEIMYLGYLLDVNPFDQPQVELYKKETREILAYE